MTASGSIVSPLTHYISRNHRFNGIWSSIHSSASASRAKSTSCFSSFQRTSHRPVSGFFLMTYPWYSLISSCLPSLRDRVTPVNDYLYATALPLNVSASDRIPELDHTLALDRIGQASVTSGQVVTQMLGIGSRRDCARHCRMRHDEFQKELRPGRAPELSRPGRNSHSTHAAEQIAPAERTVSDNPDF